MFNKDIRIKLIQMHVSQAFDCWRCKIITWQRVIGGRRSRVDANYKILIARTRVIAVYRDRRRNETIISPDMLREVTDIDKIPLAKFPVADKNIIPVMIYFAH